MDAHEATPAPTKSRGMPRIFCLFCLVVPWMVFMMREFHLNTKAENSQHFISFVPPELLNMAQGAFEQFQGTGGATPDSADQAPEETPVACRRGTWKLTLLSAMGTKCSLRNRIGGKLCATGEMHLVVNGDECMSFQIVRVDSCSAKDLKCNKYNCQRHGVLRLEMGSGEVVDVGTNDKMLTCANFGFTLEGRSFCEAGDLGRCAEVTWTTTTTTLAMPTPKLNEVLEVVSSIHVDKSFKASTAFDSCALVDTSSSLVGKSLGTEIDGHDTIIRVGGMPTTDHIPDFGNRTDIFFSHDKNVQNNGFFTQFIGDDRTRRCGPTPNSTCIAARAFVWLNVWNDMWIQKFRRQMRDTNDTIFVGATKMKVSCVANLLLNQRPSPPLQWNTTTWRWPSPGFVAFLNFGYLCRSLRLYGFGGLSGADQQLSQDDFAAFQNITLEHSLIQGIRSGSLLKAVRANGVKCAMDGLTWLKRSLTWFGVAGRITLAAEDVRDHGSVAQAPEVQHSGPSAQGGILVQAAEAQE